jgi:ribose transport system substrate-binding protein
MKRALLIVTAVVLAGCSSTAATPTPAPTDTPAAPTPVVSTAPTPAPTLDVSTVTVVYSGYSTSNTYWNILGKSAATEATAKGVKFVDVTATTNDSAQQLQAVNSALATLKMPAALIIGSVDNRVWGDTIAKAKAAGIPILAVDTGISDPYISALIQTDNEGAGNQIGDLICKNTGGKGTALVLGGTVGAQSGDARKKGVEDKIKACGMTDDPQFGDWDSAKDVTIATAAMASIPDLTAIFVPHSDGAAAVAKAVADKGKTSKIGVYGFDGSAAELTAISNGTEVASIHQDNVGMGKTIVDDAVTLLQGGKIDPIVLIKPVLIDKSNVDTFKS